MGKEEQKEITAIFRDSLRASLRLNMFLACIAITLLGTYLENMRRDLKDTTRTVIKLEANVNSLKATVIKLEAFHTP